MLVTDHPGTYKTDLSEASRIAGQSYRRTVYVQVLDNDIARCKVPDQWAFTCVT